MSRVLEFIEQGLVPGGSRHNADTHGTFTDFAPSVPDAVRIGLSDAQTSGGLLISVAPNRADRFARDLQKSAALAAIVGEVREGAGIIVR